MKHLLTKVQVLVQTHAAQCIASDLYIASIALIVLAILLGKFGLLFAAIPLYLACDWVMAQDAEEEAAG
jgi:phage shock protein PspC (stress-responsive transcriptional regulator)